MEGVLKLNISDGLLFFYFIPTIIIGFILYVSLKEFNEYKLDKTANVERTDAKIIAKRTELLGGGDAAIQTVYYITFELFHGIRKEFKVPPRIYGQLLEADKGTLKYQRKRFVQFDRAY